LLRHIVSAPRQRIVYRPSRSDNDMSTGPDSPLVGAEFEN
jgi:hypothetical protein